MGIYKGRKTIMTTASWVIIEKETGMGVLETFNSNILPYLNTAKYEAIPILEYLHNINAQVKNGAIGTIPFIRSKEVQS